MTPSHEPAAAALDDTDTDLGAALSEMLLQPDDGLQTAPTNTTSRSKRKTKQHTPAITLSADNTIATQNSEYSKHEYWEQRFQHEPEYEWLTSYKQVESLLLPYLPNKQARILIVGCGNSNFSADLYDAGYHNLTSIDFSAEVIQRMLSKHRVARPGMQWQVMDMTRMTYGNAVFDVVIDKAAMDALTTDERDPWDPSTAVRRQVHLMCKNISRVLKPAGTFLQISFQQPHFRTANYLNARPTVYKWTVSHTEFGQEYSLGYFFYVCQKQVDSKVEAPEESKESDHSAALADLQQIIPTSLPKIDGLHYMPNFITDNEQQRIVELLDSHEWSTAIHRRQQYYGQRFYFTRHPQAELQPMHDDDTSQCYALSELQWLIDRCKQYDQQHQLGIFPADGSNDISQVLVNEYVGHAGISSHFDDSTCFGDYIITISLLQPILMTLKKPTERTNQCADIVDTQHLILEPCSMFIKTKDARYAYRHGITKRRYIQTADGIIIHRGPHYRRISLTLRQLLDTRKRTDVTWDGWFEAPEQVQAAGAGVQ